VEFETAPLGIGIVDVIPDANNTARTTPTTYMGGFNSVNGTQILVDPLTNERIDAKILLDQNGRPRMSTANKPLMEVHDYWFSLDFKLLWTKGPQAAASTGGATGATGPTRSTAAPVSSPAPTRSAPAPRPARKSSKKLGGFGD
jgi:hypothetical protein